MLINKRKGANPTTSAARIFKRPLQQSGQEMSLSTYSSFIDRSKSKIVPPFGSKDLRFDGKLELMEYFNRDPGPGTYSENASTIASSL